MPEPTTLPYGPATPEIRKFLQRLAALSPAQEAEVVAQGTKARELPAYRAAEVALSIAVARSARVPQQQALAGPLIQLLRVEGAFLLEAPNPAGRGLRAIAEPALAALLALMMRDVLQPAHVQQLYAAFAGTIPMEPAD